MKIIEILLFLLEGFNDIEFLCHILGNVQLCFLCLLFLFSLPDITLKEGKDRVFGHQWPGVKDRVWPMLLLLLSHFSRVRLCVTP